MYTLTLSFHYAQCSISLLLINNLSLIERERRDKHTQAWLQMGSCMK